MKEHGLSNDGCAPVVKALVQQPARYRPVKSELRCMISDGNWLRFVLDGGWLLLPDEGHTLSFRTELNG